MDFKVLDSKYKEIYFSPAIVDFIDEDVESSAALWNTLNSLAIQNFCTQRVRQIA